jgi:hypothetical protein
MSFRKYRQLKDNEFIVIGADTASGGSDRCAAQFISQTNIDVPIVYHSEKTATEMTNELYPFLNEIYDITGVKPVIAYERNNGGVFELERLASMNREGKFKIFKMPTIGRSGDTPEAVKYGWDTNTATRPAMLQQLKEAVDKRVITLYDKATIEEMFSFVVMKTSFSWKAQAESSAHDDLVMALAIAWQLYQMESPESLNHSNAQMEHIYNQILNED